MTRKDQIHSPSGRAGRGLPGLKGDTLPGVQNRWFRSPSSIPDGVPEPLGRRFFEVRFFDGLFDRLVGRFGSQSGAKIDQTSKKKIEENRMSTPAPFSE